MLDKADVDTQWPNAILTLDQVAEELTLKVDTVRDLMRRRILFSSCVILQLMLLLKD